MRCRPAQIFQPRRAGRGRAPRLKAGAALLGLLLACLAPPAPGVRAQAGTLRAYSATPPAFDAVRAFEHVRRLVEFGPRPAGSEESKRAREYIVRELKSSGLKVERDEFGAQTPLGKRKMVNVWAELPGETRDLVLVASHYDTKLFKDARFVGANDGGSSTAVLLEAARALSASARRNHFTYRFVFFDGEEAFCREWDECGRPGSPDNTYGSRRYVARLRERGELSRVRALVLLDMVGYKELDLGRDTLSTKWLADAVWETARELGHGAEFKERAEEIGGDDHAPFLDAGVPSLDIIQLSTYPHWHTPDDTLDKISPRSLGVVGRVLVASLPRIEERLKTGGEKRKG
jgi:glutaminyl-peptide cyclotransferase